MAGTELLLNEAATTAADMLSVGVMLAWCTYIFTVAALFSYLFSHLFCFRQVPRPVAAAFQMQSRTHGEGHAMMFVCFCFIKCM